MERKFVRTIPLGALMKGNEKPSEEWIELSVRGMHHGFVELVADDGQTYICAKEKDRGAMYGDRVAAERMGDELVVVRKVIEHAHPFIVGVLRFNRAGKPYIQPLERRLPPSVDVMKIDTTADEGDIVRTKVVRWPDEGFLSVRVVERIGGFDQATHALTALVRSSNLREDFPEEALAEADACRPANMADDSAREDLRGLVSFTIDGRDAKDFDDAVSFDVLADGTARLGVHIADVGHYVPQGSALDHEAYLRGTSVYLPGRVLPMLPEQLSNGVCSLRPDEDKFTISAMMEIDGSGVVRQMRLARTITRSKARLVYDDVNALFAGDAEQTEVMSAKDERLIPALMGMRRLAKTIRQKRENDGCIDFDTSEPQFILDAEGEPTAIIKRERGEAEMMIEDFMLTANECVAKWARENGVPLLYRVHEKPDPEKLRVFSDFLAVIGAARKRLSADAAPGEVRALLEQTKDRPEYSVISELALRSMQKARYDAQPLGHYGLAMPDYCHFTSPIRRYPDLVVSRAITAVLMGERAPMIGDRLEDAALRSSDCERAAVEAERAADKLMMARFMAAHVGEAFRGVVSGVTDWGMYVELSNGAEGFIHVRSMDDWFEFDERRMTLRGERTGAVFSLGQALEVVVESVELTTSAIDLVLTAPLRPAKREKSERKKERERMREFWR